VTDETGYFRFADKLGLVGTVMFIESDLQNRQTSYIALHVLPWLRG